MTGSPPIESAISFEELNEILAEATGTTPEEIRRGAEEFEIAPPWKLTSLRSRPSIVNQHSSPLGRWCWLRPASPDEPAQRRPRRCRTPVQRLINLNLKIEES